MRMMMLVALVALLAGCGKLEGTAQQAALTEYQYHWISGCDAVLWVYSESDHETQMQRGEALHRMGCEKVTQEQQSSFLKMRASAQAK